MIDLIENIFSDMDDKSFKAKIDYANKTAEMSAGRLAELEQQHERLKLVTMALWEMLRDYTGLVESDLKKYVETVDLKDGKRDGRIKRHDAIKDCDSCKRKVLKSALVCPYCANPMKLKSAFDGV